MGTATDVAFNYAEHLLAGKKMGTADLQAQGIGKIDTLLI
jgi:hypothetical protein